LILSTSYQNYSWNFQQEKWVCTMQTRLTKQACLRRIGLIGIVNTIIRHQTLLKSSVIKEHNSAEVTKCQVIPPIPDSFTKAYENQMRRLIRDADLHLPMKISLDVHQNGLSTSSEIWSATYVNYWLASLSHWNNCRLQHCDNSPTGQILWNYVEFRVTVSKAQHAVTDHPKRL